MNNIDPHAIYRAIEADVIAVPPASKAEVLELLEFYGQDTDGTWTTVEATRVLDKMLKFQQKAIQIVKIVAPAEIKVKEMDACREVWLEIFKVKRAVMGILKDQAA